MQSAWEILAVLVIAAFFAGPILAIVALVRISALCGDSEQVRRLTSRIFELEQRIAALDRGLQSAATISEPPRSPVAAAAPEEMSLQGQGAERAIPPSIASEAVPAQGPNIPVLQPQPAGPQQRSASLTAPLSKRPAARAPDHASDVESVLGGKWLYYLGILALVFAVAFFLKYAFDNDWIGPAGRVGIGVLIGGAMFPLSDWLTHRGYRYFSEGITGLGATVLYLSIWSGWHYYTLFSQPAAFALMIVITGLTAAVAVGRNSQRIAVLALAGGALTPSLVSTGENAEFTLFMYLLILGAAMLAISGIKIWKWLPPLQFAATLIYFWGWYASFYADYELQSTLIFATIFFALFAALPAVRSMRDGELSPPEVAVVIANALQYLGALRWMLWPEYRWELALAVLVLAAAHLFAERALPAKSGKNVRVARAVYGGLALTFATLSIPILLDGKWITIAWAIEGAALVWSGLQVRSLALRAAGILLLAVAAIRLAAFPIAAGNTFLLNARFLTMTVCAACFLAAFLFASRFRIELGSPETQLYYVLAIAANVFFLAALSLEVWDFYGRTAALGFDRSLAQNLALSILWLVYAVALLVAGVLRKSAVARWQALALLGVVVVKVFFFDLSFLARFYRIVSFFLLGLALLVISFFYQRRSASRSSQNQP
jgi:uncharacterized membrane protein